MSFGSESDFDIALVGDFRFPGGTSTCIANEITAQAKGGYRTVLVQIPRSTAIKGRSFHPDIIACIERGEAQVVPATQPIKVKHLTAHHPFVFMNTPKIVPQISWERACLVVHQSPADGYGVHYDPLVVAAVLRDVFGSDLEWAPVGPGVRSALLAWPELKLTEKDWYNILDFSSWNCDRSNFVASRPVIGRHSRPGKEKWPALARDILAAYPESPEFKVRVLGGGDVASAVLTYIPHNWDILPFNSVHPRTFLQTIDFFVYYHSPDWHEAFGRTILEALASGCVTIVPKSFAALFGNACIYAEASEVQDIVRKYYANPALYKQQSRRGQEFVKKTYGLGIHLSRLEERIGRPTSPEVAAFEDSSPGPALNEVVKTILFVTSNGEGLGHLTRMMALIKHLSPSFRAHIATLSYALEIAKDMGIPVEYIPRHPEMHWSDWNPFLKDRLLEIIRRTNAHAVVFDGNAPYAGITEARASAGIPFIWVRRAMWKPNVGETFVKRSDFFDLIIEPGEVAGELDEGLTVPLRGRAELVGPITLLDTHELLDRSTARRELALAADGPIALIQLGSDNMNDIANPARVTSEILRQKGFQVVVARSKVSSKSFDIPTWVKQVEVYPLSRYLNAFELAISAAGYNSFHENLRFGCPTVFIPMDKETEKQSNRSQFAQEHSAALEVKEFSEDAMQHAVSMLLDPAKRDLLAKNAKAICQPNGAQKAMATIERLVSRWDKADCRTVERFHQPTLFSGREHFWNLKPDYGVILFYLVGVTREEQDRYVSDVIKNQIISSAFIPIFATTCSHFGVFRRFGLHFEYLPGFDTVDMPGISPDRRMAIIRATYAPNRELTYYGSLAESAVHYRLNDMLLSTSYQRAEQTKKGHSRLSQEAVLNNLARTVIGRFIVHVCRFVLLSKSDGIAPTLKSMAFKNFTRFKKIAVARIEKFSTGKPVLSKAQNSSD